LEFQPTLSSLATKPILLNHPMDKKQ